MQDKMKEDNYGIIVGVLIEVLLAVMGVVAYHLNYKTVLLICAVLCALKMLLVFLAEGLRDIAFPFLAVCMAVGFYVTSTWTDVLSYGICLYYSTAIIYLLILQIRPLAVSLAYLMTASLAGIAGWLLHVEWLYVIGSLYCVTSLLIAICSNRIHARSYWILTQCIIIGPLLWLLTNTVSTSFPAMGLLLAAPLFYLASVLYAFFKVYIRHEKLTAEELDRF